MAPGTRAHTHDGQRQAPRDRPDIRAHLTGSFPNADRRLLRGTLFRMPARSPARIRLRRPTDRTGPADAEREPPVCPACAAWRWDEEKIGLASCGRPHKTLRCLSPWKGL